MPEPLYTTNQLAKLFGVVPTTVIDWIEKGKLEAFKTLGGHRRITHRAVLEFLERNHLPYPPAFAHDAPKIVVLDAQAEPLRATGALFAQGLPDSRVFLESHAVDALVRLGVERPRLFVFDGQLPGIDPLELCRRVKENAALAPIRIVALVTEIADPQLAERLRAAGADEVLTRGGAAGELVERSRVLLKGESSAAPAAS
jgi:excisionase family DNA binding protein